MGLDVREGVEIQLPCVFHQIGLLVELARACNSNRLEDELGRLLVVVDKVYR
jgi:hypothetical protein